MKIEFPFIILLMAALAWSSFAIISIADLAEIGGADPAGYLVMARGLLEGEGFVSHTVKQYDWVQPEIIGPDYIEPPGAAVGIALFFKLFGETPLTGKLFTLLAGLLVSPLLVYGIARAWNLSPIVALFAGLFTLCYPVSFFSHLYALSDDPMTMWVLAGLLCFFMARGRMWFYVLSGVFLAFAGMTKYSAFLVWIALGLYAVILLWKKADPHLRLSHVFLLFLVALAVASPLLIRNQVYFGNPVFTVVAAQTWTLDFQEPDEKYKMFFWDEGPATLSWALHEYDFEDLSRKYARIAHAFIFEEGLFVALALLGCILMIRKPETLFILICTAIFFFFFLLYNHYEGRYFLVMHALWCIPMAYLFFHNKSFLRTVAGIGLLVLLFGFIGLKFIQADTNPYGDSAFTHNRAALHEAIINLVPQGEPVMTYYPRQSDFVTRHPILMQVEEDPGTTLRIMHYYGANYVECGPKAPELDNDPRFQLVFDGYYDLCKVDWKLVFETSPPIPALVNITQDWSFSRFRPYVQKISQ